MESLGHIIHSEVNIENWKPIQLSLNGPHLSHLFFADDLVLFAEASIEQARIIKECLDLFCKASEQKVNFQKSNIFFSKKVLGHDVRFTC